MFRNLFCRVIPSIRDSLNVRISMVCLSFQPSVSWYYGVGGFMWRSLFYMNGFRLVNWAVAAGR